MRVTFSRLSTSLPFSGLLRKFEQEMEAVIKALQPGPLGIIEHKFSAEEIRQANATIVMAVQNWRRNSKVGQQDHPILSDYIQN